MAKKKEEGAPLALRVGCSILFFTFPLLASLLSTNYFITATRDEAGAVRADVYPCILLVIPRGHDAFGLIDGVGAWVIRRESRLGEKDRKTAYQGTLILEGPKRKLEIPVSSVMVRRTEKALQSFLDSEKVGRKTVYTVRSFAFSLMILPLLLLYCYGMALLVTRGLRRAGAAIFGSSEVVGKSFPEERG